jgi:hypothetical protein
MSKLRLPAELSDKIALEQRKNLLTLTAAAIRRSDHGGMAWKLPFGRLRQPQDGASVRTKLANIGSHFQLGLHDEPEDAKLTGGTRSLMRRLTGLNMGLKPKKAIVTAPVPVIHTKVA